MNIQLIVAIVQTIATVVLSIAGVILAYLVYKIQRDRNTAKLVLVCDELIEDDESGIARYQIRVLNFGLVPAVRVRLVADIEEWKDGIMVRPSPGEEHYPFQDTIQLLASQDSQSYELPMPTEGRDFVVTAMVTCHGGLGDDARFGLQGDSSDIEYFQAVFREVSAGKASAMKRLTGRHSIWRDAKSLKNYDNLYKEMAAAEQTDVAFQRESQQS